MLKKCVFVFLAAALLLGGLMAPSGSALAARPEPPAVEGIQPPALDFANPPDIIQKGVNLQNSLTVDQHTAVRAILDKYLPQLQSIHEAMAAQGKPQHGELNKMDAAMVTSMKELAASIEADMASVLSADQLALFQAVTKPTFNRPEMDLITDQGVQGYYTDYCLYGAYEDAGAWYYSYWGYLYGYYDYYYYGGDLSYNAWYYAYYGMLYADAALSYSGWVYFAAGYWGMWWTDFPYYAYYYSYYSYYYMYYAEYYAYWNYYYYGYGYDYAYYGWAYDYYGLDYAYWAYYDTYYCYYYLY